MVTSSDNSTAVARGAPPGRVSGAERRALIEDAGARLFARNGYDATTVDQIVREAGVSKPMLYRHFESKKDLCMVLLERRRDELAAAPLDEFISSADSPPGERLLAMIDAWFAHVQQHPDSCRILFQDVTFDADIRALQLELRARQRAADIALLHEFGVRVTEVELEPLAEVIRSSLSGLALWWLDNPSVPRATVTAPMLRMTLGLLYSND
jgi:AcrR family transcriptional regulator